MVFFNYATKEITAKITVSDTEIKDFYEKNKANFTAAAASA